MSVKETPMARVKRLHKSKENLIDSLVDKLDTGDDESKGEFKHRLMSASNKKLLRLHDVATAVAEKYGGKDQLVEAICKLRGKGKDADYASKLHGYSLTRLYDMTHAKRAKRAAASR